MDWFCAVLFLEYFSYFLLEQQVQQWLVFERVSLSSVSLTVMVGQTARWPPVQTTPTTAALGWRPPSLTWARTMTTMTNLMKTTTRTKPSPRSACPSCTSSSSCHVRGLINHIVLFPLLWLTVSFTLCLRRALKNTGFNRMSCFHPRLSELRTSHIITGVLCLLGMIVFSWRT